MLFRRWLLIAVLVSAVLAASCGGGSEEPTAPPEVATPGTQAAVAPTEAPAPTLASGPVKLDMEAIFPLGPGRDLSLNNCTNCHNIAPIVTMQKTRDEWERTAREHRESVLGLSDEEFETLFEYLIANFNPERPVPEIPQILIDAWTSY